MFSSDLLLLLHLGFPFSESMVQGLDEEEAAFLNKVVDMQDQVENRRFSDEIDEIKQFRVSCLLFLRN